MQEPKMHTCLHLWLISFLSVISFSFAKLVTYAHFTRFGPHDIIRMILALERLLASGNTMREIFFKKL